MSEESQVHSGRSRAGGSLLWAVASGTKFGFDAKARACFGDRRLETFGGRHGRMESSIVKESSNQSRKVQENGKVNLLKVNPLK
jgi:hypothetical protein